MEQVNLTTPDRAVAGIPQYSVYLLSLDWDSKTIIIGLKGPGGNRTETYTEADGAGALLTSLNKANLTVQSLHRRIINKLLADGRLAGTVSGTVD